MAATTPPKARQRKPPTAPDGGPPTEPTDKLPVEPAIPPVTERSELDRLDDAPSPFTLHDGTKVQVKALRTREFLSLMRIITRGAGHILMSMAQSSDPEELFGQLLGILILAIPEAQEETITFLRQVVEPYDVQHLDEKKQIAARSQLWDSLDNPHLDDTISIIEAVLNREKDDLVALGKRMAAAINAALKANLSLEKI